ncbi:MAG: hypothetical protein M3Q65_19680 [Chloroflexota bacterium]|nr:hypothetical protein [Chloroflexota bacterium]
MRWRYALVTGLLGAAAALAVALLLVTLAAPGLGAGVFAVLLLLVVTVLALVKVVWEQCEDEARWQRLLRRIRGG